MERIVNMEDEETSNQLVTEEPYPGWQRFEVEGQTPWYKTPIPRTVLRSKKKLLDFLSKEHKLNRMLDVDIELFSFKRRLGLRKPLLQQPKDCEPTESSKREVDFQVKCKPILDRLSKNTNVIDHRRLLLDTAKKVDEFQKTDGYKTPENFERLKNALSSAQDLR